MTPEEQQQRQQRREDVHKETAARLDRQRIPWVPCATCKRPTTFTGTERCNGCWEVEYRLVDYLRDGGANARAFVEDAMRRTA